MHVLAPNQVVEKYPYTIGNLRKDNPTTSFTARPSDETLAEWNMFPVKRVDRPEVDHTKDVSEGNPVLQNGEWVQVWNVTDASAEEVSERTEQQAEQIRAERNQKLSDSDWTQVADAPVNKQAWAEYRQALREIPDQAGFPWSVEWPKQP
jgi:hypothetical protein